MRFVSVFLAIPFLLSCSQNWESLIKPKTKSPVVSPSPIEGSPVISPDAPVAEDPLPPEMAKPELAKAKVDDLMKQINQDPNYEIGVEDVELLTSEGLIDSDEIKGLVK
ncbi:hypothetical protein [Bdellovibrio bacteriovorus]|uniref:hypothetical protein n=1 Tax=Bdellovibrio bacteriovorus TaxID=959 RepID=UPI003AA7E469